MKHLHLTLAAGFILLGCSGCATGVFATHNTPADLQQMQQGSASTRPQDNIRPGQASPQSSASSAPASTPFNYASAGQDCGGLAQKRMAMYDRPDTYPISDQERKDAYQALYSSCMREHNFQVAGPARAPSNTNYAQQFAALSPAAGGNRGITTVGGAGSVSTSSVPGATVVVIGGNGNASTASQLSSLSPSSGGGAYPPNATVVLVQSPQGPAAALPMASYTPPSGPLPVAVPIAPPQMAKGYAPASPRPVMASQPATAQYSGPQPSLAGAETAATGAAAPSTSVAASEKANQQLENVLEQ